MRNIAIILLILALIGGGAYYFFSEGPSDLKVESILPEGAQLYVHVDDVDKNLKRLQSSPFWKSVSSIDLDELAENDILNSQQLMVIKQVQSKLNEPQIKLLLERLFGKEFAVAIYPLDVNFGKTANLAALATPTFIDDALSNFMILSRVSSDVQAAEFFSGFITNLGANGRKENLTYKDFKIHSLVFDQLRFRISYVRVKDILVVTLSERAAQKVIDTHLGERDSLEQSAQFKRIDKRAVSDSQITLFWDMVQFHQFMKEQTNAVVSFMKQSQPDNKNLDNAPTQIGEALSTLEGFNSFLITGKLDSLAEFKFTMDMDTAKLTPDLASFYTCDPVENKTIDFVPKDVLGYQWNGCLDLKYYWDQFKLEMAKSQPRGSDVTVAQQIAQIESVLGLSVEGDLLPSLGDEFGGYLQDIQVNGVFPLPKFLMFVEVKNKAKIDSLFSLLSSNPLLVMQSESYKGVEIQFVNSPLGGEEIQPSYCYLNDYLLISINKKIIKSTIDAQNNDAESLADSSSFKEVDRGLSDKNMSVFYAQMGTFANKLEDLIEWANNWAESSQRQREALKAGSQQRLDVVIVDIEGMERNIANLKVEITEIEATIAEREEQAISADSYKEELNNLNTMVETREKDLASLGEQKSELENLVDSYAEKGLDSQKRELFLNNLIYPLLNGLSSVTTFGGRTTIKDEFFESHLLMKVNF